MLANSGIPLGNQSVLLKDINDDISIMKSLVHKLLKCRVRPYYLYQCDLIEGSSHLRTPAAKGIEIIEGLRGHTSGYAVPQFVIDAPGGGGKIPINPEHVVEKNPEQLKIRNYEGKSFIYPEPKILLQTSDPAINCRVKLFMPGIIIKPRARIFHGHDWVCSSEIKNLRKS